MIRLTVFDVFEIKGHGRCVSLTDKAFAPGDHEALEVGSLVRRKSDGAEWTIAGIEAGVVRTGAYLLKGDAVPRKGDVLECEAATWPPENRRGPLTYDRAYVYLNGKLLWESK